MHTPKISVLMPVYNAEKYIDEAVESILKQTFTDFELIIIDDGSTDQSSEHLKKYVNSDSRIKLINRENQGLVSTLNQGIACAKGKYIARMDADDISHPTRLSLQYTFLEQHQQYVVVGSRICLIDEDGSQLCEMGEYESHKEIDTAHINNYTNGATIVHPTALVRRESLIKVGGYDAEYLHAEDIDLWLKLAEIGKVKNLKEVLLMYRQHTGSIGYTYRKKQLQSIHKAINDACFRRGLPQPKFNTSVVTQEKIIISDIYIKWGWWALKGGHIKTMRKYAIKAFLSKPYGKDVWRLIACALRGY